MPAGKRRPLLHTHAIMLVQQRILSFQKKLGRERIAGGKKEAVAKKYVRRRMGKIPQGKECAILDFLVCWLTFKDIKMNHKFEHNYPAIPTFIAALRNKAGLGLFSSVAPPTCIHKMTFGHAQKLL